MRAARLAERSDLAGMLALFAASEVSAAIKSFDRAETIWSDIIGRPGNAVFIGETGGEIVATCMLIMAPNLLRDGYQHAFLENVVTHPAHRGQGWGQIVVQAALRHAWDEQCHQVLLQSGRAEPGVHRFYERLGFKPGVRTAYAAARPD